MNTDQPIDLAKAFTTGLFKDFDKLPKAYQKLHVQYLKQEYMLYQKRYKQNSKKTGGAPKTWEDIEIQDIIQRLDKIVQTDAYKNRAYNYQNNKYPGIRAYIILLENLYETPEMAEILKDMPQKTVKECKKSHKKTAKALKTITERYIKKTGTEL